ncbi:hypothetical protein FDK13_30830 [Dyadobacter frigoris]|uniref:Uncharacterized protein n=2 Tax=Dyadobacter frigoris TaxID=2576211 RepID=A0A4U6CR93_9BACT|nr:hypothetical protein FDK13_30830 [Dyadobacter frigoris]
MLLKNGHIIIPADIVTKWLDTDDYVNMVYYPERSQLLVAAKSKTFFEKLHKTKWMVLKDKNLQGDKTLYVREILIDNDLDDADRPLRFEIKTTGIVTIDL